jgi:lactoylglutathione lyase
MPNEREYTAYAIRVFVRDWRRALAFYHETLGIPIRFESEDLGWAQLDTGECSLAVERLEPGDPEAGELIGRDVGVSLQVEDIHATHQRLLSRGVEFVGAPEREAWGGVLAHLRDPEGNTITLLGS